MNQSKIIIMIVALIALLILGVSSMFIINEGRQAIITQFGRPIGKPYTQAGLYFKTPFLQEVRYVDKRILSWGRLPQPDSNKG